MQTQEQQSKELFNRILIFDADSERKSDYQELLAEHFNQPDLYFTDNFDIFTSLLKSRDFDVLVLAENIEFEAQLLFEFKLLNCVPAVIVISNIKDPHKIAEYYNCGAQRCIIYSELSLIELGTAIRSAVRLKKLEAENLRLLECLGEANKQLLERNKRLDEFTGTVAHDIRGPLGGINMRLEYIRDAYSEVLDDKFTKIIDSSLSASQRLIDIVQAMYDYAKLGIRSVDFKEINLSQFLRDVISDLNVSEDRKVNIGLPDLPNIWGNPGLLRKVFINLINNSVKYNNKSEVVINIGYEGRDVVDDINCEKFFIEDNGPGIPEEERGQLFEMFQRGSTSLKTDGLGVGLAVVKKIIELHKGQIDLDSNYKAGCRFLFTLPAERVG